MIQATTDPSGAMPSPSSEVSNRRPTLVSLMNQSTIYRRHEARLARSYALRDDPRPAVLRVMAGLPGFRIIVPRYQPNKSKQEESSTTSPGAGKRTLGDYSEETFFNSADGITSAVTENNHHHHHDGLTTHTVLQAMFSAGTACAVGEYLFGGHHRLGRQFSTSLFQPGRNAGASVYSPFIRGGVDSSLGVHLMKSHNHVSSHSAAAATATSKPATMVLVASSSTSLLFGTKICLENTLLQSTDTTSSGLMGILSSAIAGTVVGVAQMAVAYRQQQQQRQVLMQQRTFHVAQQTPMLAGKNLLARHVLAATLYFAIYDGVSSWMTVPNSQHDTGDHNNAISSVLNEKSTASILSAGALAGCAHASVLNYQYGMLRSLPAATRAAPIHAMVFYAYERMKEGMRISQ